MPYFDTERKKAFFEMPFDISLFVLSHKLNSALFVVFYQPLTIPRKSHHSSVPKTSLQYGVQCAKRLFTNCHHDNSQKRGRTLHPSISAERLQQQGNATCPTTFCNIKWHLMSSNLGISPTTINSGKYPFWDFLRYLAFRLPHLHTNSCQLSKPLVLHFVFNLSPNNGIWFFQRS